MLSTINDGVCKGAKKYLANGTKIQKKGLLRNQFFGNSIY